MSEYYTDHWDELLQSLEVKRLMLHTTTLGSSNRLSLYIYILHKVVINVCCHNSLVCLLLFCAKANIFHLYHGGNMMYKMKRRVNNLTDSRDL